MGFWDLIDDAKREIAWKAEELVDSVKDVASDIADGTMKEKITDFRDEWKENFKELKEIVTEKDPNTPTLKELGALAVEEIKENPLKGGAIAISVLAAPILAVGAGGAVLATLAQMGIVAGATKLVEEIRADSKITSACNKIKAATEAEITEKYKERMDIVTEIGKENGDIKGAMICAYMGGQAFLNEANGGTPLSDEEYNTIVLLAGGAVDKAIPTYCKKIFEQYKTQTLTVKQAQAILKSEEFEYSESFINDCFTPIIFAITDMLRGEDDAEQKEHP